MIVWQPFNHSEAGVSTLFETPLECSLLYLKVLSSSFHKRGICQVLGCEAPRMTSLRCQEHLWLSVGSDEESRCWQMSWVGQQCQGAIKGHWIFTCTELLPWTTSPRQESSYLCLPGCCFLTVALLGLHILRDPCKLGCPGACPALEVSRPEKIVDLMLLLVLDLLDLSHFKSVSPLWTVKYILMTLGAHAEDFVTTSLTIIIFIH